MVDMLEKSVPPSVFAQNGGHVHLVLVLMRPVPDMVEVTVPPSVLAQRDGH